MAMTMRSSTSVNPPEAIFFFALNKEFIFMAL
jgi:hypothetical protein